MICARVSATVFQKALTRTVACKSVCVCVWGGGVVMGAGLPCLQLHNRQQQLPFLKDKAKKREEEERWTSATGSAPSPHPVTMTRTTTTLGSTRVFDRVSFFCVRVCRCFQSEKQKSNDNLTKKKNDARGWKTNLTRSLAGSPRQRNTNEAIWHESQVNEGC